jgi:hypothetical protein
MMLLLLLLVVVVWQVCSRQKAVHPQECRLLRLAVLLLLLVPALLLL